MLITGGAGYIGSCVANIFLKKKYNVYIVDDLSTGNILNLNKKVKFYNINISNYKKIREVIINNNIKTIIHLAGKLDAAESEVNKKKYFLNNCLYTKNILKSLQTTSIKKFIFASSAAIYKDSNKPSHETSDKKPINYYGLTKLHNEQLIESYCKKYKINFGIIRFFNVVGSDLKKKIGCSKKYKSLFNSITYSILKNKNFFLNGINHPTRDGTCLRDFIHVLDIANIHYLINELLTLKKKIIINAGYGKNYSIKEVLNTFEKVTNKKIKITVRNKRTGDISESCSQNNRLIRYGFKPRYNNLMTMVKHHFFLRN